MSSPTYEEIQAELAHTKQRLAETQQQQVIDEAVQKQASALPKTIPDRERFDGTPSKIQAFISFVQNLFLLYVITNAAVQIRYTGSMMMGNARDWFFNVQANNNINSVSWAEFEQKFRE